MASPNESFEERTEPATPFRREEFRRSGKVALSRELLSVLLLSALGAVLYGTMTRLLGEFTTLSEQFFVFSEVRALTKTDTLRLMVEAYQAWAWMVGPLLVVGLVVGLLGCASQVGFHVTWEPLNPNWDRLNPVNGFKRLLSMRGLMEAGKAIVKLSLAAIVLYFFLRSHVGGLGNFLQQDVTEGLHFTMIVVAKLFFGLLVLLAILAIGDYAFQRWQLEKEMRMTRRETKDEFKLREGDPLIKSRIRTIQKRIARQRMMEDVPHADVVVTNPTHFAVALKYDREAMPAPKVVAKGAGVVAQKIKEIARNNKVPTVENKPLARTLFKQISIGQFVPRELYKAVAEVLAYVYRLRGMVSGNG